jgi:cation transport regulator ChaB
MAGSKKSHKKSHKKDLSKKNLERKHAKSKKRPDSKGKKDSGPKNKRSGGKNAAAGESGAHPAKKAAKKSAPTKAAPTKSAPRRSAPEAPAPAPAGRAPAVRRPASGPAPKPRPAVRRSGLEAGSSPTGADLPSTVERSDQHAQATWSAVHDAAVDQYGEGERAHRTAFAALKNTYEKVGDHWEAKAESGPSDSRAASPGRHQGTTAGGVDATASRAHLYRLAQRLDIPGRSRMTRDELVQALQGANDQATARARQD